MILRAKYVLPMDGPPLENGAVSVDGDCVTALSRAKGHADLDLGEAVLFPGLINAHCHLDYTNMRGLTPYRGDFLDWILRLTALKKQWSDEHYIASINRGLAELAASGTTTVVNIECFPQLVNHLAPSPLRVWWCVELLDLTWGEPSRHLLQEATRWLESQAHGGLAPHAPYTTSMPLYRLAARVARTHGWLLTTHLAESREEDDMFRRQRGPMWERYHREPVSLQELSILGPTCLLAHANFITDAEADAIGRSDASIAHCPRSHRFFGREPAPWDLWRRHGINVCLGTDSLASNDSLDLRAEMRLLTRFPPREVLAMATVNAARALNCEGKLGTITIGSRADLVAVPLDGDPYESVACSEKPVCFSMVGGKVLLQ